MIYTIIEICINKYYLYLNIYNIIILKINNIHGINIKNLPFSI